MPARGVSFGNATWLRRLEELFRPEVMNPSSPGTILPVSVQNQAFGTYSRMPQSRLIFESMLQGAALGENGLVQIRAFAGYDVLVHAIYSSQTINLTWRATDLTGGLTGEADTTLLWGDDPWPTSEGAARITGTVATASIAGTTAQLQTASIMPPFGGATAAPGLPWCRIRAGEAFIISNDTANEAIALSYLAEIVRGSD